MKGHVKNKLQLRQLSKDSFLDSLPLLRRELPLSPSCRQLFCLCAPHGRCGSLGEYRLLQLQIPAAGVLPETLSLLRFAWLADWVAVCQPWFYWRLRAYSYFWSCEGAYSSTRSSGLSPGTPRARILSLDLERLLKPATSGRCPTANRKRLLTRSLGYLRTHLQLIKWFSSLPHS